MRSIFLWVICLLANYSTSAAAIDIPAVQPRLHSGIASSAGSGVSLVETSGLGASSLTFVKNMGQWPDSVLYRASAGGSTIWFVRDGVYYQFTRRIAKSESARRAAVTVPGALDPEIPSKLDRWNDTSLAGMIKVEFSGASSSAQVAGVDELNYKCNFFLGNDRSKWRTDVPSYSILTFSGLYPGVDVSFRGVSGRFACTLEAVSNDALSQVTTSYRGAVSQTKVGDIDILNTSMGEVKFCGLVPAGDSSPPVASRNLKDANVGLIYSTYLGGSGPDAANGIAVDSGGSAYIFGNTASADFPTILPLDGIWNSFGDIFITKLSPSGHNLVFSTFLGGSNGEAARAIALDIFGHVFITGNTFSADFPTVLPFDGTYDGGTNFGDAFVAKLSPAGDSLLFSTFLGGNDDDKGTSIAVDQSGSPYVSGGTYSTDFPTANAFDASFNGRGNRDGDAFVTKLAPSGSSLVYSTYLGGSGGDASFGVAVDTARCAYLVGYTSSADFPTSAPFQNTLRGHHDVFVTKLTPSGTALVYSTYLGGDNVEEGYGIAVDREGSAYVTGSTNSVNFPLFMPVIDTFAEFFDAFVTKLSPSGSSLMYSTYLGGNDLDEGDALTVDHAGSVCVTGSTWSTDFPTAGSFKGTMTDLWNDAFLAKLNPAGNSFIYSTYLGGSSADAGAGIAVDGAGDVYITGTTESADFPTYSPYAGSLNGTEDAFVMKLSPNGSCCGGTTGNVNATGIVDLGDLSALVSYLAGNGIVLLCPAEANVNATGIVDLSDLSALVSYLTGGSFVLPNCP